MIISKKKYEMAIKEAVEKEMSSYDMRRFENEEHSRLNRRVNSLENKVHTIEKRLGMLTYDDCNCVTSF